MSTRVRERLRKDRPMTSVTIRVPEDVLTDLRAVASQLGFASVAALVRAYIGRGLRKDLAKESTSETRLVEAEALLRWVRDEIGQFGDDDEWIERINAFLRSHPSKQPFSAEET